MVLALALNVVPDTEACDLTGDFQGGRGKEAIQRKVFLVKGLSSAGVRPLRTEVGLPCFKASLLRVCSRAGAPSVDGREQEERPAVLFAR